MSQGGWCLEVDQIVQKRKGEVGSGQLSEDMRQDAFLSTARERRLRGLPCQGMSLSHPFSGLGQHGSEPHAEVAPAMMAGLVWIERLGCGGVNGEVDEE